jgi:hypothetical protein
MRFANAFAAALILLAGFVGTASAQDETEDGVYAGHIYVDFGTGLRYEPKGGGYVTQLAGDVYNNTNPLPATLAAFSSTDLAAQWGDRVTTTGTGILQENDFTFYNSSSSAGPILTASFGIGLYNAATNALLGSYSTTPVNFGVGGLLAGQFTIITVTGLGGLNVNVNTNDVLMVQQVLVKTGTGNRLGIVSANPPTIGSSANTMYINATTVGPAGYYTVTNVPNPGYRINLSAPVSTTPSSWGAIKAIYKN